MRLSSLYNYLKPPRGFKLTKAGKIFFVFLFGIIVISMATGNNLLYLMLAGILAFMIVSGIESELNLRYLELDRVLPAEIYAGRSARIGYLLRNKRNSSERLILKDISQIKIPTAPASANRAVARGSHLSEKGQSPSWDYSDRDYIPLWTFRKIHLLFPGSGYSCLSRTPGF